MYVPKETLHSHKNVGERLGEMLVVQTLGGLYEGFLEKVGKPAGGEEWSIAFDDGPEVRRTVKTADEYGIEIPLPIA